MTNKGKNVAPVLTKQKRKRGGPPKLKGGKTGDAMEQHRVFGSEFESRSKQQGTDTEGITNAI